MVIFVSIWRQVYNNQGYAGSISEVQTINYIIAAQVFAPLVQWGIIYPFGLVVRDGRVAIEMSRPLDLQMTFYADGLGRLIRILFYEILFSGIIGVIFFGLQLPTNLMIWLCFIITLLLGNAILFCFDWIFACLAFYTTETWGLSVLREGVVLFLSGALVPLVLLPDWLQNIVRIFPFAQALYIPLSLLTEITTISQIPNIIISQICWLFGMAALSRIVFQFAVQKITIQGG